MLDAAILSHVAMPRLKADPDATSLTVVSPIKVVPPESGNSEACLVMIHGPELGRKIVLNRERAVEIGRQSSCDVFIDQDSVSRRQARVFWDDERWQVEDLGSTNGTYVNDRIINQVALKDGDRIQVARIILKFFEGGGIERSFHEEIYRLMTSDSLTSAYNRRYFDEAMEREVSRCKRYEKSLSLILMDLDKFKPVNDTYGHISGDAVLRQFAHLVLRSIRQGDIFARVGGDEFALMLPETGLSEACSVAEKLRSLVEKGVFQHEGVQFNITLTLGVGAWTSDDGVSSLYSRADSNLYKAKSLGRNRVAF